MKPVLRAAKWTALGVVLAFGLTVAAGVAIGIREGIE